jgi:hydrogenase nickel incorporation protein HypA/HybF
MHESSLARQIVQAVVDRAAREGARRVLAVRGWVAETESLSPDSLTLHFTAHARGTPAEGARLELRVEHIQARCNACAANYTPDHHVLLCPQCGATDAELLGTPGLGVDAIEVD